MIIKFNLNVLSTYVYIYLFKITDSKMVRCAVTLDTSFAQRQNREYKTVNKTMLLNSACIVPWHTNMNKQLKVK